MTTRKKQGKKKEDDEEEVDGIALFYRDLLDALHCYLVHQMDIGIRIKVRERRRDDSDHEDHRRWTQWEPERGSTAVYKFVCRIQCQQSDVFVFCTKWCHARSH